MPTKPKMEVIPLGEIRKMKDIFISPEEAEDEFDVARNTLAAWRQYGHGPTYVVSSASSRRRVFYRRADLAEWFAQHPLGPNHRPRKKPRKNVATETSVM